MKMPGANLLDVQKSIPKACSRPDTEKFKYYTIRSLLLSHQISTLRKGSCDSELFYICHHMTILVYQCPILTRISKRLTLDGHCVDCAI